LPIHDRYFGLVHGGQRKKTSSVQNYRDIRANRKGAR